MFYTPAWAIAGLIIVLLAVYDFYVTTVTVDGGGPLTKPLSRGVWRGLMWLGGRGSHKPLKAGGPLILLLLILVWFSMCWLGWFLVFCGTEQAVINASTNKAASVWERVHYAGYTLTTIGYGNFRAANPPGQFASIVAGLNGLFLVTLAITYSIPVVSAVVEKRKLSILIHSMGKTTAAIVDNGRGDGDFSPLVSQIQQLSGQIAGFAEKHYAYPVLHYFHAHSERASLALNLARLSDAIDIVLYMSNDLSADTRAQLGTAQRLVSSFLATLEHSFSGATSEIPASPDCRNIQALASSPHSAEHVEKHLASLAHRKLLLAYVVDDGWSWTDVHPRGDH